MANEGFDLEVTFDFLCLFVPGSDAMRVILPDLRQGTEVPEVRAHQAILRWEREQQEGNGRNADYRSLPTSQPDFRATKLEGEDIRFELVPAPPKKIGTGPPKEIDLEDLIELADAKLDPEFTQVAPTYFYSVPTGKLLKLAARFSLMGGKLLVKGQDITPIPFELLNDGTRVHVGHVARRVTWQVSGLSSVEIVFSKFGGAESGRLRLAPAPGDVVSVAVRNCDGADDILMPGLPNYAENHRELQAYLPLSMAYAKGHTPPELLHRPAVNSQQGICAPAKAGG